MDREDRRAVEQPRAGLYNYSTMQYMPLSMKLPIHTSKQTHSVGFAFALEKLLSLVSAGSTDGGKCDTDSLEATLASGTSSSPPLSLAASGAALKRLNETVHRHVKVKV